MPPATQQAIEFFWRRLEEPPELLGHALEFHPLWWLFWGGLAVAAAWLVILWCYRREARTVGRWPATAAGFLRCLSVLVLFIVWLLPAVRRVEITEQSSRVLLLHDVSASVTDVSDAASEAVGEPRATRQDELLSQLLRVGPPPAAPSANLGSLSQSASFLDRLLLKNPLVSYRFGDGLDPQPWLMTASPSATEVRAWLVPRIQGTFDELPPTPWLRDLEELGQQVPALEESPRRAAAVDRLLRAWAERGLLLTRLPARTNLGAALRDALRRESGNQLQGAILFSDGRATSGAEQELTEAVELAAKEAVPVFTVALGRDLQIPNVRLVDVLAPARVQPEDEFPLRIAVEGEHLPARQAVEVVLAVEKPGRPAETLESQSIVLTAVGGRVARGAANFRITNPEKLKGDWKFRARVSAIAGERTRADNIQAEPTVVKVEERKLEVLLFASAPSREYQFVRAMLAREPDKFALSICLQSAQPGTVQDIEPKRLLERFPAELRERDADPNNLGNYDVVVAFDPDWRALLTGGGRSVALDNVRRWIEDQGGALVAVAGTVHTFTLARLPELQVMRNLYPVILDDTADSFQVLDRPSKDAWALNWDGAAAQQPFLDLEDTNDPAQALLSWEAFFEPVRQAETGHVEEPSVRGFFSYFPVKQAKPGAAVLARFGDPARRALTPGGERQPYFVLHRVGKGPVFYMGSGETYRLRQYSERYHERFWTKLLRQLGKRESSRGLLTVGSRYLEGDTVVVEAELLNADLRPLEAGPGTIIALRVLPPANLTESPRAWSEGLPMTAEKSRPGAYVTRFPVKSAGSYKLELRVPSSGEVLTAAFRVESSDPERDDTRPDFAALWRLASPAASVRLWDEARRPGLTAAVATFRDLVRSQAVESGQKAPADLETDKLCFTLDTMGWIPECLDSNISRFRTEGQVTDLWDKGLGVFFNWREPEKASGVPWVIVVVTVLLGSEWFIRKLWRLA